jgi:hypothetical protein
MQFVSLGANHTAHAEALVEQLQGLSLGPVISFFLPDQGLDLLG